MSAETLLIILFVGLVAGWVAGQIVQGRFQASVAEHRNRHRRCVDWKLVATCFGHPSWRGHRPRIIGATLGAVLLLLILRLVYWKGRW